MASVWSIEKNYIKKYKKKICAIFCKKVIEQQGREIVPEQGKEEVNLVCYHVYEPGDQILLEAVTAENPRYRTIFRLPGDFSVVICLFFQQFQNIFLTVHADAGSCQLAVFKYQNGRNAHHAVLSC